MSGLIILLEIGLFALLLLLAFRMLTLTRSEPFASAVTTSSEPMAMRQQTPPMAPGRGSSGQASPNSWSAKVTSASNQNHPDKCELISKLHILASLQERDCREQDLDIETAHIAVREYAVAWLYGAASALSHPSTRDQHLIAYWVSQFASKKIGIKQPDALAAISTLTRNAAMLGCFRSGIEGAEFWAKHHYIPRDKSMFEAVTSNTFV